MNIKWISFIPVHELLILLFDEDEIESLPQCIEKTHALRNIDQLQYLNTYIDEYLKLMQKFFKAREEFMRRQTSLEIEINRQIQLAYIDGYIDKRINAFNNFRNCLSKQNPDKQQYNRVLTYSNNRIFGKKTMLDLVGDDFDLIEIIEPAKKPRKATYDKKPLSQRQFGNHLHEMKMLYMNDKNPHRAATQIIEREFPRSKIMKSGNKENDGRISQLKNLFSEKMRMRDM
jgi:hypothetical protein